MSLSNQEIKNIYVVSTAIIIMVVLLLAISMYKSQKKYEANNLVAIKTSRGLIKMNSNKLADELSILRADLARHSGYERTSKFDIEINNVLYNVKTFIDKNPHNREPQNVESKARILSKSKNEKIKSNSAFDSGMTHLDDENTNTLDILLLHFDILINMLTGGLCDGGMLDVASLERISDILDSDNSPEIDFDKSTEIYEVDIDKSLVARGNPFIISKLPMFSSQVNQIEGLNVEAQIRNAPVVNEKQYSQGPQNVRNAQQRSQMFRENNQKIGLKHYVDEDLLFTPTYDSMAL